MMAWEERFHTPMEQIRDRESRDWWEQEKRDRIREQTDVNQPEEADDGPDE